MVNEAYQAWERIELYPVKANMSSFELVKAIRAWFPLDADAVIRGFFFAIEAIYPASQDELPVVRGMMHSEDLGDSDLALYNLCHDFGVDYDILVEHENYDV